MLIGQITQERRDLMSIEDFITDLLNVDINSIEKLSVVDDKKCIKLSTIIIIHVFIFSS